eukprot:GHUV01021075.1.p1 GENE.GHUV01021075.1~~GHUV01021075.1.p1  ORF type:complete len:236 (+),score=14.41 GHUV01021075.1:453-1160(+)
MSHIDVNNQYRGCKVALGFSWWWWHGHGCCRGTAPRVAYVHEHKLILCDNTGSTVRLLCMIPLVSLPTDTVHSTTDSQAVTLCSVSQRAQIVCATQYPVSCCCCVQEARSELLDAFKAHPWLNMLHLHVGSQGLQLDTVIAGIKAVWELLQELERQCGKGRIRVLDIGGGLSVDFTTDDPPKVNHCYCWRSHYTVSAVWLLQYAVPCTSYIRLHTVIQASMVDCMHAVLAGTARP